ncbi:MAG: OB-fold nucleic acid binding domain-containing protein [Candidatus Thermoplasmatota archaeon]|jgi:replication factor A1|nr:OB-fold nucleic acid binding domain-containing protein [Candidatus Thermoplasmatota archaeon]
MSIDDLKSHIDDILDVLSEDSEKGVSREELEREFKKFLEYGVPVEQAKQTLIKKFGGAGAVSASAERKLLVDVKPNESNVNLLCRVITINPKEITVKGEKRNIFYGILGDESGTAPFTAWKDFEIAKGDVIEVSNAYSREWRDSVQINFGDRVKIKKTEEDRLQDVSYEPKEVKVRDLKAGLGAVDITARIIDINERETVVDGKTKKVFSGTIGDETGKAQFTSWHDFNLKEGDVVRITGGYIKSWKGIPQLSFDDKAVVKKLDGSKISRDEIKTSKIPLHLLVEKRGALDVEIEGTVIEIHDGSGIITRCPECNRSVVDKECKTHGKLSKVKTDLRVKLVVDDGSGSVNCIIGKDVAERILGKTLDECKRMVEKTKDDKVLVDLINKTFFARRLRVDGNALGDSFGTTVIAKNAELVDVDIKEEAERLSHSLEELR